MKPRPRPLLRVGTCRATNITTPVCVCACTAAGPESRYDQALVVYNGCGGEANDRAFADDGATVGAEPAGTRGHHTHVHQHGQLTMHPLFRLHRLPRSLPFPLTVELGVYMCALVICEHLVFGLDLGRGLLFASIPFGVCDARVRVPSET